MAAVKDLFYDIESLFIEGMSAAEIAKELACPVAYVNGVLDSFGVNEQEEDIMEYLDKEIDGEPTLADVLDSWARQSVAEKQQPEVYYGA